MHKNEHALYTCAHSKPVQVVHVPEHYQNVSIAMQCGQDVGAKKSDNITQLFGTNLLSGSKLFESRESVPFTSMNGIVHHQQQDKTPLIVTRI
jgi:hypothetical protein